VVDTPGGDLGSFVCLGVGCACLWSAWNWKNGNLVTKFTKVILLSNQVT
jgi:hypothetical protein